MPDIVLPYEPADGSTFDPTQFNKDIYELPANLGGNLSLYETSNGGITFDNLATGFRVRSHMIRPWQVGDAQSTGAVKPLDWFGNAWGQDVVWYGVAGANMTFYQPYSVSLALFFDTIFASIWRQRGQANGQDGWADPPEMFVRMHFDGTPIPHAQRRFPQTIYFSTAKDWGGGYDFAISREERLTRYLQLHTPKLAGGSAGKGLGQLTAGWHSFGLQIYIAQNTGSEEIDRDGAPAADIYPNAIFDAMPRVRLFVRHADVLRLL